MSLVKEKLQKFQERLLDISNRNRMLNSNFQARSKQHFRFIDEVPNQVYEKLMEKGMDFIPLPDISKTPDDEKTKEFKSAYEQALLTDEDYLNELEKIEITNSEDDINQQTEDAKRALKNKVRAALLLPSYKEKDPSLEEHARIQGINPAWNLPTNSDLDQHQDSKIQTLMLRDEFERYMRTITNQYKSSMKEQGVNPLYVCFGFLEWRENPAESKKRLAPLLMMQVSIEERGNRTIIKSTGDDIIFNQTLNEKLKRDFKKELPKIEFESNDDKTFDIHKYLEKVEEAVANPLNFRVLIQGSYGVYNAQNMPIFKDLERIIDDEISDLLKQLLIGSSEPINDSASEIYDVDDKKFYDDLPSLITHADASQYSAVKDAVDGKNLVIKGPPGTGKSQTITNIIAALMQRKKKVLFVAQKQAALEVVRNKLKEVGLGVYLMDIFSVKANKQSVLESFKERNNTHITGGDQLVENLKETEGILFRTKNELNKYAKILSSELGKTKATVHTILWDIPNLEDIPKELEINNTKKASLITDSKLEQNMTELSSMVETYKDIFKGNKHTDYEISKITKGPFTPPELEDTENQLNDFYQSLKPLFDELNRIEVKHAELKSSRFKFTEEQINLINKTSLPNTEKLALYMSLSDQLSTYFENYRTLNKELIDLEAKYKDALKWQAERFNIDDDLISLDQIKSALIDLKNPGFFSFLSSKFRYANKIFSNLYMGEKVANKEKHPLLYGLYNFKKNQEAKLNAIKDKQTKTKTALNKLISRFQDEVGSEDILDHKVIKKILLDDFKRFGKQTKSLTKSVKKLWIKELNVLQEFVSINEKITKLNNPVAELVLDLTKEKLSEDGCYKFLYSLRNCPISLRDYNDWWVFLKENDKEARSFFTLALQHNKLDNDLNLIYKYVVRKAQKRLVYEQHRELAEFNGKKLKKLITDFKKYDAEVEGEAKKAIAYEVHSTGKYAPTGNRVGKVGDKTEMGLINHVSEKTKSRTTIRELLYRAGDAATTLKPCTLMSPLTVSQSLPLEEIFDVVVIDEASQMKPEFALSSIARAKQAIIVGDPKQLPPTSFFQSSEGDSYDDDFSDESILDMALTVLHPPRELLYHYRSRHEDLIKFSNAEFYKNLLIPMTANTEDKDKGIKYIYLEDALYKATTREETDTGVRRTVAGGFNQIEAERVVQEAINVMKTQPDKSLGIATMNIKQRDFIEKVFELEASKHPEAKQYLANWQKKNDGLEELFIKNLENVQGDERDIIIISTLFGPLVEGTPPPQRFGGLNSENGWRRLNVLFTRAKNQMIVVTSIKSNQIVANENSRRGVQVFKKFLSFLETGLLETSSGNAHDIESPFQQWAIDQIEAKGFEAIPEVGEAGYRIDIGVKHPQYPGYIMAIETDGATYHSSHSARDRDILRQQILEGYGWHFYRIWSTDWINDPIGTKEKLQEALDDRLEECLANLN